MEVLTILLHTLAEHVFDVVSFVIDRIVRLQCHDVDDDDDGDDGIYNWQPKAYYL